MSLSMDSVVVGSNPRMRSVFDFVRVIAESESNVLITGETGTGKEVIAHLIHDSSHRRRRPFIAVSCAMLAETLIETELFGHERGAFTGAWTDRPGRFELAEGGTVFLDDIDDVPMSVQVKLLRALQNRTIERVGGTRPVAIDVRVITGSKRPLKALVMEGKFRADLYYRLDVMSASMRFPSSRITCAPRFTGIRGRATCVSSRTRASASRRPAPAARSNAGARPPTSCFIRVRPLRSRRLPRSSRQRTVGSRWTIGSNKWKPA
jgi:transcriptional regulator of aromatic amino acid metabolism